MKQDSGNWLHHLPKRGKYRGVTALGRQGVTTIKELKSGSSPRALYASPAMPLTAWVKAKHAGSAQASETRGAHCSRLGQPADAVPEGLLFTWNTLMSPESEQTQCFSWYPRVQ